MGIGAHDLLSVEFQNQTQHTVGSRMLGTKVDSVMTDLAGTVDLVIVLLKGLGVLGLNGGAEVLVGGDHACTLAILDLGIAAGEGGRQWARNGSCRESGAELGAGGVQTHPLGGMAGQTRDGDGHVERDSLEMPV
jgi:hypothetical protein